MKPKPKQLDQMRQVMRLKHMSYRTEQAYVSWVRRFILFHHKRHPNEMGATEIRAFLASLEDLAAGYGEAYLPYAFVRKEPSAGTSWTWQYVFPASKRSIDPRSAVERRHHLSETVLQRAVKDAIRRAGISKRGSCHTLRHYLAPQVMLSKEPSRGGSLALWPKRLGIIRVL